VYKSLTDARDASLWLLPVPASAQYFTAWDSCRYMLHFFDQLELEHVSACAQVRVFAGLACLLTQLHLSAQSEYAQSKSWYVAAQGLFIASPVSALSAGSCCVRGPPSDRG
jgi:hypothetical protein